MPKSETTFLSTDFSDTFHDDQEAREKALRAGGVAFLGKPFSDEALLTAVRSALEYFRGAEYSG